MTGKTHKGTGFWLKKLTQQSMPVVGQTIAEINALTGNQDVDVNQLAEVILRDPNLTAHVLRVANSVQYNYSNFPVNTVSRAIVIIGLKGMRAVCISLLMIDSLLRKEHKEQLLQLMAQGVHAATQARELVKQHDPESEEEVFVAGLLYNLGEMAFLANETSNQSHDNLFSTDQQARRQAMDAVLGTSFKSISLALAKYWHLGDTLIEALSNSSASNTSATSNKKVQAVLLGERISRAALHGWSSPDAEAAIADVAEYATLEHDAAKEKVQASADLASEVAFQYGAAIVCQRIPSSKHTDHGETDVIGSSQENILEPDANLQLNILRELNAANAEKTEVSTMLQMVLEGMHRGIGLERVSLAFVREYRAKARFILGDNTEKWRSAFDIDCGPYTDNIFTYAIETTEPAVFLDDNFMEKRGDLYDREVKLAVGQHPCFVAVLKAQGRAVALFYADRANFGGKLCQDQFDSFRHFAQQAENYLMQVSEKEQRRTA